MAIRWHIPLPGPFAWTPGRRRASRKRPLTPAGLWIICVLGGVLAVRTDPIFAAVLLLVAAVWAVLWWLSRR